MIVIIESKRNYVGWFLLVCLFYPIVTCDDVFFFLWISFLLNQVLETSFVWYQYTKFGTCSNSNQLKIVVLFTFFSFLFKVISLKTKSVYAQYIKSHLSFHYIYYESKIVCKKCIFLTKNNEISLVCVNNHNRYVNKL